MVLRWCVKCCHPEVSLVYGNILPREWWEREEKASEKALEVEEELEDQASPACHREGLRRGHGGAREPALLGKFQLWAWCRCSWRRRGDGGRLMRDLRLEAKPSWKTSTAEDHRCWNRRTTRPAWHLGSESLSPVLFPSVLPIFGRSSERHCQKQRAIQGNGTPEKSVVAHLRPAASVKRWNQNLDSYLLILSFGYDPNQGTQKKRKFRREWESFPDYVGLKCTEEVSLFWWGAGLLSHFFLSAPHRF